MTVRGSVTAVPPNDDAWDEDADEAFHRALPAILREVFAEHTLTGLVDAICAGGEELVYDVSLRMEDFDERCLAGRIFDRPRPLPEAAGGASALLDLRPGRVEVRIPVWGSGVRLGEMVAGRAGGEWIDAQGRGQLRLYADLVAPLLYAELERDELRRAALTDQLTGLANRRALDHELEQLCLEGRGLCLLLLDVDGLKEVNDAIGYAQGDHLISTLARSITDTIARRHIAARMGGDEFIVMMPDTTEKQARKLAKRITRLFERQPLHPRVFEISGSVSVGVVEARPGESPRELVRRAARSMRTHKRRRRTDRASD
jgi:diguanylate cyclase (GGDEF)-like protein